MALHPLDMLSICTGGAGLDLGVELAIPGARSVCMVEREAYAVARLVSAMEQGLLAPAAVWSDARTFDGRRWRGCVDGLIGGIPCQPHSVAGRKRGSLDGRDLWSDARRIVVQARPWFVLIENVAGMLSAGADQIAGAERVWRDLRKLGFAVEGGLFTAAEVGASHGRERLFILGVADACRQRRPEVAGGSSGDESADEGRAAPDRDQSDSHVENVADARDPRSQGGEQRGSSGTLDRQQTSRPTPELRGASVVHAERPEWWPDVERGHQPDRHDGGRDQAASRLGEPSAPVGHTGAGLFALPAFPPGPGDLAEWAEILERAPGLEPAICRMADGLADRVDQLRLLGNGVVPLQAAYALRTLVARLAGRGSAGAAELARMMEAAE